MSAIELETSVEVMEPPGTEKVAVVGPSASVRSAKPSAAPPLGTVGSPSRLSKLEVTDTVWLTPMGIVSSAVVCSEKLRIAPAAIDAGFEASEVKVTIRSTPTTLVVDVKPAGGVTAVGALKCGPRFTVTTPSWPVDVPVFETVKLTLTDWPASPVVGLRTGAPSVITGETTVTGVEAATSGDCVVWSVAPNEVGPEVAAARQNRSRKTSNWLFAPSPSLFAFVVRFPKVISTSTPEARGPEAPTRVAAVEGFVPSNDPGATSVAGVKVPVQPKPGGTSKRTRAFGLTPSGRVTRARTRTTSPWVRFEPLVSGSSVETRVTATAPSRGVAVAVSITATNALAPGSETHTVESSLSIRARLPAVIGGGAVWSRRRTPNTKVRVRPASRRSIVKTTGSAPVTSLVTTGVVVVPTGATEPPT